jgi:predicted Zn-dependent peptidase
LTASFSRVSLAEGVNLYVQPTAKFKTTVIYVYLHLPLSSEVVTRNALLPMVLARGSADFPTTAELSRHLDDLYGAAFGYDVMRRGETHSIVFRLEVAGDAHIPGETGLLKQGMETLASILTHPAVEGDGFKADYFAQESTNLQQMIESLINDKRRLAMVRCTEEMCKGEAFALYRMGRVEDLPSITPQSLLAYHNEVLTNAPMDIFIIGEVDPKEVQTLVEQTFKLPSGGKRTMPVTNVKREPGRPVQEITDHMDVNQGVLVLGIRTGITIKDPEYAAMLVANGVLGGFPHSKLFQEVREKNSLAYFAYSAVETLKGVGFMYAGIEFADMPKCKEIMLEQLKAVQDGHIDDEEFETTIRTLVNDTLGAADSPGAMADLAVDQVFVGHNLTIEERVAAYKSVTKEQAAAAARKFVLDTVYFLTKSEGGESHE